MPGVRNAILKLSKLKDSVRAISEQSIEQVKPDLVEAQKDQLLSGTTSTGGTFRKYRSAAYASKKNSMNSRPGIGNPDLKLTGAFYRGIQVKISGGRIRTESSDSKAQELEAKYGANSIYGLNPQEMNDFITGKLRPVFNKNFLDALK